MCMHMWHVFNYFRTLQKVLEFHPGVILGHPALGPSQVILPWVHLRSSWSHPGLSWVILGSSYVHLGFILDHSRVGLSWVILGLSWVILGSFLGYAWVIFVHLWSTFVIFGTLWSSLVILRSSRGHFVSSWGHPGVIEDLDLMLDV